MPIITSLLDLDFYKLTMAQVAWNHFRNVPVVYGFANRTSTVALPRHVREDELRAELAHIQTLRFSPEEINWLRTSTHINALKSGFFSEEFLSFLAGLALPPVTLSQNGASYTIEVAGPWPEAILWETLVLGVVNELYYRAALSEAATTQAHAWIEGEKRLRDKIALLKNQASVRFVEFGTRRRFSRSWQERVVETLLDEIPSNVLGTSNVLLAKNLGVKPVGTFAHEMFMVLYGLYADEENPALSAHNKVLELWWKEYAEPLSIALTDTFGTDFFLAHFTPEQARAWRGLRQDSGDPIEIGEKVLAFYERNGIDPRGKIFLCSDGLTLETMLRISDHFSGRMGTSFGWGTNLTNDLGFRPLSLVMKAIEANGRRTVKLSDNPAKATGQPDDIERIKQQVGYAERLAQPIIY